MWANMNQNGEMEGTCHFLTNEEDNLPDAFDVRLVHKHKSDSCSLCNVTFSVWQANTKMKNCSRCGLAVCPKCSNQRIRLSKIDTKKYRVCDKCDTLMANPDFEKMLQNLIEKQNMQADELQ
jgi:hypothetical protein